MTSSRGTGAGAPEGRELGRARTIIWAVGARGRERAPGRQAAVEVGSGKADLSSRGSGGGIGKAAAEPWCNCRQARLARALSRPKSSVSAPDPTAETCRVSIFTADGEGKLEQCADEHAPRCGWPDPTCPIGHLLTNAFLHAVDIESAVSGDSDYGSERSTDRCVQRSNLILSIPLSAHSLIFSP